MRRYPPLSSELCEQLRRVPASHDGSMEYRPCAITLRSGVELPCVYVVDSKRYIQAWGVWPEDDRAKRSVPIGSVLKIEDSPNRLPAHLADELYRAGESGMGYTVFTVEFANGKQRAYLTGNAVDFIVPPHGVRASESLHVRPHDGRHEAKPCSLEYYWCLYDDGEQAG